jgi:hypothetical protein
VQGADFTSFIKSIKAENTWVATKEYYIKSLPIGLPD